jgi:hypothetical protein
MLACFRDYGDYRFVLWVKPYLSCAVYVNSYGRARADHVSGFTVRNAFIGAFVYSDRKEQ